MIQLAIMVHLGKHKSGEFNLAMTNIVKGMAIILMLAHHLFCSYMTGQYSTFIHDVGFASKVCVAIFVFLSGYGLTETTGEKYSLGRYYRRRYIKMYIPYWFIVIVFSLIGVFVFGRSYKVDFPDYSVVISFLANFFGVQNMGMGHGYNDTWWFMSLIIFLYLLFPAFLYITRKAPIVTMGLILFFVLTEWGRYQAWSSELWIYAGSFCMGILCSHLKLLNRFVEDAQSSSKWVVLIKLLIIIGVVCVLYTFRPLDFRKGQYFDTFYLIPFVLMGCYMHSFKWVSRVFQFLGHYSMDIFLTHTFILLYWFRSYCYSFSNPFVALLNLLLCSLAMAIALEWMKKKIHYTTSMESLLMPKR